MEGIVKLLPKSRGTNDRTVKTPDIAIEYRYPQASQTVANVPASPPVPGPLAFQPYSVQGAFYWTVVGGPPPPPAAGGGGRGGWEIREKSE